MTLTAGNRNDITELLAFVDRVPPTGRYGKFRPKALLADRAYDSRHHRKGCSLPPMAGSAERSTVPAELALIH